MSAPFTQFNIPTALLDTTAITATGGTASRSLAARWGDFLSVMDFGAVGDGVTDDTVAVQAAINAAAGKVCFFPPPHKFHIANNLTIPGNTTLKGGFMFSDSEDIYTANFGTLPAILLNSTATISANGEACQIENCLIYRYGMTFPAADSSQFAGLALTDANGNNASFSIIDCCILGFDCCVRFLSGRSTMLRVFCDGTGVNNAVVDIACGNRDLGLIEYVKVQPMATGNGLGAASQRPGTGVRSEGVGGGTAWFDHVISQNFNTMNFDFQVAALVGDIWSDMQAGFGLTAVGVNVAAGMNFNNVYINGGGPGMVCNTGGGVCRINLLNCNGTTSDALVLGTVGGSNGSVSIGMFDVATAGGYAVNVKSVNCAFYAATCVLANVNGKAAPYFHSSVPTGLYRNGVFFNIGSLLHDLAVGTNLFQVSSSGSPGFYLGTGAAEMMHSVNNASIVIGTPSGLGSAGTIGQQPNSDCVSGIISMFASGTGIGSVGHVTITRPLAAASGIVATATIMNGTGVWAAGANVTVSLNSLTALDLIWNNNGVNLTSGLVYWIAYRLDQV